ncbi:MAG: hypothetical protein JNG84_07220, partial [Archangium sp.]|nr:hypothetical protein [Archangium sp.]
MRRAALIALGLWSASGCTCTPPSSAVPFACEATRDCADDFVCLEGTCVLRAEVVVDAGLPGSFAIAPRSGPVGTLLTLSRGVEVDFSEAAAVRIGGVSALVVNASPERMQVLVMPGTAGGPVVVTRRSGGFATSEDFEVVELGTTFAQRAAKLRPSDAVGRVIAFGSTVGVSADGKTILAGGSGDDIGV